MLDTTSAMTPNMLPRLLRKYLASFPLEIHTSKVYNEYVGVMHKLDAEAPDMNKIPQNAEY